MREGHAEIRHRLDRIGGSCSHSSRGLWAPQASQTLQGHGSDDGRGHFVRPHLGLYMVSDVVKTKKQYVSMDHIF